MFLISKFESVQRLLTKCFLVLNAITEELPKSFLHYAFATKFTKELPEQRINCKRLIRSLEVVSCRQKLEDCGKSL